MPKYTAEQIEREITHIGRIRKNDPACANDSGYWTGGRCDWGGGHILKEDCQQIVRNFDKLDSLGNMKTDLLNSTSQKEFETKKRNYLTKCEELISSLNSNGSGNYAFYICIIWGDKRMGRQLDRVVKELKKTIETAKNSLANETYKWVEEINQINLEIRQIEQRMEENKRKAINEKDPVKKAALIQAIEDDGKVLTQKLGERAKLQNRHNFDANKYANDIVEAMKKSIERRGKDRAGSNGNRNPRTSGTNNADESDDSDNDSSNDDEGYSNKKSNFSVSDSNNNQQQFLIFAVIALVVIFLLLNKKEQEEELYY